MCKHIYNPEIQYPKGTPFTYLIGWSKLNKFYYGVRYKKDCHPFDIWTNYFTSSPSVWQFRIDNGEPDIVKVDYIFETKEEALAYEEYFLTENDCGRNTQWLNLHNGGKNFCQTEDSIKKMANSLRGKPLSAETIKKRSNSQRGKKRTPEQCLNMVNSLKRTGKRKPSSAESIKKIADALRGRKRSVEICQKIADGLKGKIWINNGNIEKFVKQEEVEIIYFPQGFVYGRIKSNKNRIIINNGIEQKMVTIVDAENIFYLQGFVNGKLQKNRKKGNTRSEESILKQKETCRLKRLAKLQNLEI